MRVFSCVVFVFASLCPLLFPPVFPFSPLLYLCSRVLLLLVGAVSFSLSLAIFFSLSLSLSLSLFLALFLSLFFVFLFLSPPLSLSLSLSLLSPSRPSYLSSPFSWLCGYPLTLSFSMGRDLAGVAENMYKYSLLFWFRVARGPP